MKGLVALLGYLFAGGLIVGFFVGSAIIGSVIAAMGWVIMGATAVGGLLMLMARRPKPSKKPDL